MELKDYFRKVGSDPCLVIDFHTNATMASATEIHLVTEFGEFENETKANEFIDKFTKMLEKETETRQVVLRDIIDTADNALSFMIGSVIIASQPIFSTKAGGYREMAIYVITKLPNQGIKIGYGHFVIAVFSDYATVTFRSVIDLT